MPQVAIATGSQHAADAGRWIAEAGGNAVDCAIASSLVTVVSEPGMVSLGGGGFISIWPADGEPVTIDGGVEMPGRSAPADRFGQGGVYVEMDYHGWIQTVVGPGSVATPGILAAYACASQRYGRLPWPELIRPAIEVARNGFPLSVAAHRYLALCHKEIYASDARSFRALHDQAGHLRSVGSSILVEDLADSLEGIAREGAALFYAGELGARIADHIESEGGLLSRADLAAYQALERQPVRFELAGWQLASAPPPSIGGPVLAAMLTLWRGLPRLGDGWGVNQTEQLIRIQQAVLARRYSELDVTRDLEAAADRLLNEAVDGPAGVVSLGSLGSPSTVHTSSADADGQACSITVSSGYGSGIIPPGTGIWMNNSLGEPELNRRGFHGWDVGERQYSNMAPTVGRGPGGESLAIGSPGADRITTAQMQVLINHLAEGMSLQQAVAHPRLHVEEVEEGFRVAFEPGMPVDELQLPQRNFGETNLFFGGVAAVKHRAGGRFECAADPRRSGVTATAG